MIERLLGDLPPAQFLEQHYTRLPFSRAGGARGLTSFSGWPAVEAILGRPGVDAFLAREGSMWEGGKLPSSADARREFAQGRTLVIRSAERHDPELARMASEFQADLRAPVNVHVYCTPAERSGFGWHYDPEDVFILQVDGTKEYRLRKNTVNPWPLLEQMPKDLRFEREVMPLWSCVLSPGDVLYIPTGWWHCARGVAGDSITLAVGLMTPSAIDLLDALRNELLSSVVWRQRLPLSEERLRALLPELAKDLHRSLQDPSFVRSFLDRRTRQPGGDPPKE